MTARNLFLALSILLLIVLGGGAVLAQSGGAGWYDLATDVRVSGDLWVLDDLTVSDDMTVTDALAVADLTASDDVTVDDLLSVDTLKFTRGTTVTVTAGSTITPTATYINLASAGVVTTSTSRAVADGSYLGQVLLLVNSNASDAITVDGTGGNVECASDRALGTKDSLLLIWNGADWLCFGTFTNN